MKIGANPQRAFGRHIAISSIWGTVLLAGSIVVTYLAAAYATANASNPVNDIILDNLPTMDVETIFVYGFILFFVFVAAMSIYQPRRIPFVLKSFAVFNLIRSFFIILTHVGPSAQQLQIALNSRVAAAFTFTGDLFFSGHTGVPFLMALVFWDEVALRWLFLATSVFFGAIVLLGHFHYSIDVFAAFFITYGIFKISVKLFPKDFLLLRRGKAAV